jgi:hypothetical protein
MSSTYRKSPRAPLNIYLNKFVGNSPFMCRAANISEEGILLASLIEPEHNGAAVSLELALPGDDEVMWVHGTVVRELNHRECEASGIRFTVLPEKYRKRIARYVQRHDLAMDS